MLLEMERTKCMRKSKKDSIYVDDGQQYTGRILAESEANEE